MDEVAQADFRTDAEREECGGVLPRAEVARAGFLLVECALIFWNVLQGHFP